MTTTLTTPEWIADRLCHADFAAVGARYADNVLLDVNVPKFRVQIQGRAAAGQVIAEDLAKLTNLRSAWSRATTTNDTVIVEYELRWDGSDGESLSRAVSILRLAGDEIVEHCEYCCGEWTAQDIVKIQAEAPIVHW